MRLRIDRRIILEESPAAAEAKLGATIEAAVQRASRGRPQAHGHAPDECPRLADVQRATQGLALTLADLLSQVK